MMKHLQQIQREVGKWSRDQFGDNISCVTGEPTYSQNALTGIVEEVGELNHVTICHHQARRGYDDPAKYKADRDDALADILIFMCDYAEREGADLLTLLNQTWDRVVSKRTTEDWDQHTHEPCCLLPTSFVVHDNDGDEVIHRLEEATISKSRMLEDMEQTGQGWAEPAIDDVIGVVTERVQDFSYSRICSVCKKNHIHHTNQSGVCSDCFGIKLSRESR